MDKGVPFQEWNERISYTYATTYNLKVPPMWTKGGGGKALNNIQTSLSSGAEYIL